MTINPSAPVQDGPRPVPRRTALTGILFRDGDTGDGLHATWHKTISTGLFRHRTDLKVEERWQ